MSGYNWQQIWEIADFTVTEPCYMCGGDLEPDGIPDHLLGSCIVAGSPYRYYCPTCGGQSTGWFAADGTEYNEWVDDLDGRPPWDPDYGKDPGYPEAAGHTWVPVAPPPRSEWSVPAVSAAFRAAVARELDGGEQR